MAEEMKKDEILEEEKAKDTGNNPGDQEPNDEPVNDDPTPAEGDENKKGFHPIQGIKNAIGKSKKKHPKIAKGLNTAAKVGAGAVIGAGIAVATLASIAAKTGATSGSEDSDSDGDNLDLNLDADEDTSAEE